MKLKENKNPAFFIQCNLTDDKQPSIPHVLQLAESSSSFPGKLNRRRLRSRPRIPFHDAHRGFRFWLIVNYRRMAKTAITGNNGNKWYATDDRNWIKSRETKRRRRRRRWQRCSIYSAGQKYVATWFQELLVVFRTWLTNPSWSLIS